MKSILIVFSFLTFSSFGQLLSGTLLEEGRRIITETDFQMTGMVDGVSEYELAVNRKGEVTSARLTKTNIKSTPAEMQINNYVSKFKFEPGTYYPKWHHVIVRITMVKRGTTIEP